MADASPKPAAAPEPKGHLLVGLLPELQRDPIDMLVRLRRETGDVVHIPVPGDHLYFIAHPDGVHQVLATKAHNYPPEYQPVAEIIGHGLITGDGPEWEHERARVAPWLRADKLAPQAPMIVATAHAMLDRWQSRVVAGTIFDVVPEMAGLTVEVVARALFSSDLGDDAEPVGLALIEALEHLSQRNRHPFRAPDVVPTAENRRFHAALATLNGAAQHLIDRRRRGETSGNDLLGDLLAAEQAPEDQRLTEEEVRHSVLTLLLAGHGTTGLVLSWALYELSQHPLVEEKLVGEIESVLAGRVPTAEDLHKLPYTRQVVLESLRKWPPAWLLTRRAKAADTIGGYAIPAHALVIVSPFVTHRHPQFWDEPEAFDPTRFQGHPSPAFFPFGEGAHVCVGNNLTLLEAPLVLACLLQRYKVEVVPGYPVEAVPAGFLRPRNGLMVTLKPRHPAQLAADAPKAAPSAPPPATPPAPAAAPPASSPAPPSA